MQKTVLMAELLAERMYSKRYIWRIQKKIARHTAFFISQENLLRSDAWHALIIVTDSQSWMRTGNGKKKGFHCWGRLEEERFATVPCTYNIPHLPGESGLGGFLFSFYGIHAAWQWTTCFLQFGHLFLTKGWLGGDGFAFQLLLQWPAWMYLTMLIPSASRTQTKHKQNNPSPINRNKFPQ